LGWFQLDLIVVFIWGLILSYKRKEHGGSPRRL
jgi:hypothetical protein